MRVENTPSLKVAPAPSNPAWEPFFAHFSESLTPVEKNKMMEFFVQQLSHEIQRHMQRMIRNYKKMREQQ